MSGINWSRSSTTSHYFDAISGKPLSRKAQRRKDKREKHLEYASNGKAPLSAASPEFKKLLEKRKKSTIKTILRKAKEEANGMEAIKEPSIPK